MKTTHVLIPCHLSLKFSHSEQKNNSTIDSVETPLSCVFGLSKDRCPRKISLYCTKLRVIICKILVRQCRQMRFRTAIIVFPLWSYDVSTVTPNRNTNISEICRIWNLAIRFFEFLLLRNLGILQIKVFKITYFWGKGLNDSLWVGWYQKCRSPCSNKLWCTYCETVNYGLGHLGRIQYR